MLLISTYVGPSAIEGLGVFADEFVPKGTLIWLYNPKFDILIGDTDLGVLPPHMQNYIARYSYPHLERPGFRVIDTDDLSLQFGEDTIEAMRATPYAEHGTIAIRFAAMAASSHSSSTVRLVMPSRMAWAGVTTVASRTMNTL